MNRAPQSITVNVLDPIIRQNYNVTYVSGKRKLTKKAGPVPVAAPVNNRARLEQSRRNLRQRVKNLKTQLANALKAKTVNVQAIKTRNLSRQVQKTVIQIGQIGKEGGNNSAIRTELQTLKKQLEEQAEQLEKIAINKNTSRAEAAEARAAAAEAALATAEAARAANAVNKAQELQAAKKNSARKNEELQNARIKMAIAHIKAFRARSQAGGRNKATANAAKAAANQERAAAQAEAEAARAAAIAAAEEARRAAAAAAANKNARTAAEAATAQARARVASIEAELSSLMETSNEVITRYTNLIAAHKAEAEALRAQAAAARATGNAAAAAAASAEARAASAAANAAAARREAENATARALTNRNSLANQLASAEAARKAAEAASAAVIAAANAAAQRAGNANAQRNAQARANAARIEALNAELAQLRATAAAAEAAQREAEKARNAASAASAANKAAANRRARNAEARAANLERQLNAAQSATQRAAAQTGNSGLVRAIRTVGKVTKITLAGSAAGGMNIARGVVGLGRAGTAGVRRVVGGGTWSRAPTGRDPRANLVQKRKNEIAGTFNRNALYALRTTINGNTILTPNNINELKSLIKAKTSESKIPTTPIGNYNTRITNAAQNRNTLRQIRNELITNTGINETTRKTFIRRIEYLIYLLQNPGATTTTPYRHTAQNVQRRRLQTQTFLGA